MLLCNRLGLKGATNIQWPNLALATELKFFIGSWTIKKPLEIYSDFTLVSKLGGTEAPLERPLPLKMKTTISL